MELVLIVYVSLLALGLLRLGLLARILILNIWKKNKRGRLPMKPHGMPVRAVEDLLGVSEALLVKKILRSAKDRHPHIFRSLKEQEKTHARLNFIRALQYWYPKRKIRNLEQWIPREANYTSTEQYLSELVAFLFEAYPVPAFVRAVWFNWTYRSWQEFNWQTRIREGDPQVVSGPDNPGFRLYFHLASGGNAARTPGVVWELSPRANAFFIQTPAHFSPMQAFWFAVLQTEHFRVVEVEEQWGGVVPIPSRMGQVSYWRLVFRKLRQEKCLPGYLRVKRVFDQLELIVFGQGELASIPALLPLAGTGLPAPLGWYSWRTLELYLQERIVAVNQSQPFYAPPGIPDRVEVLSPTTGRKYTVMRLSTIPQLLEEGVAMNHCLGLEHLYEAQNGVTSFWSVREHIGKGQEVSKLTFTLEEHRVTEIQGEQNGEPSDEALEVLWTWQFQMLVPAELVG